MTSRVTHPLVSAYLRDLELLLHGIELGERAEVMAGVHEHLDASLDPDAGDGDVRAVLAELGSPQSVADEAYAGRPPLASPAPPQDRARPGLLSRAWLPVVVGLALGLALLVITFFAMTGTAYSVSGGSSTDAAGNVTEHPEVIDYKGGFPQVALIALLSTVVLWLPPLFLCVLSPLWGAKEKVVVALALPAAAVTVTALPDLGWAMTQSPTGITIGAWAGLALAVVGSGLLIFRLCRSGLWRAEALQRVGRS